MKTGDRSARTRLGWEVVIVLALSLGASAVYAIVDLLDDLSRTTPLSQQTTTLNPQLSDRELFDLVYQLLGIVFDLAPVALVCYLLWSAARPHLGALGIRFEQPGRQVAAAVGLVLVIGVPGIGVYLAGRALGLTPHVAASGLADHWWTVPVLLLSAVRAGLQEEVIVIGYLYRRLGELGWGRWTIILSTAVLRGSYHLYQGVPAFFGNFAMGVVFGWLYARHGLLLPLIVAHALIDAAIFVGYPWAAGAFPSLFGGS